MNQRNYSALSVSYISWAAVRVLIMGFFFFLNALTDSSPLLFLSLRSCFILCGCVCVFIALALSLSLQHFVGILQNFIETKVSPRFFYGQHAQNTLPTHPKFQIVFICCCAVMGFSSWLI